MKGVCQRLRPWIVGATKRLQGLLVALLGLVAVQGVSGAAETVPHVLMLHAYNYTFPATTIVSEVARKRLLERLPVIEIEADFLDLVRRSDQSLETQTADYLREKYAGIKFDAVIVIGIGAVPFVVAHRDAFAPGAPVIFVGGSPADVPRLQLPGDVRGVVIDFRPERTLELARRLQPMARRVVVIGGNSKLDQRWQDTVRKAFEASGSELETTYWFDLAYDDMLEQVSRLPRDTIVFLLTAYGDASGRRLIPRDVAAAVVKASSAPAYGAFDTFIGTGVVGGYMETFASLGEAAAEMTLQMLAGTIDPAEPAIRVHTGQTYRVDARAMQRWGLSEAKLPPDTIVLFKPYSVWEQHRVIISTVAAVIGLQSLLVSALLFQRRRRREAEKSLRDSEARMTFSASSANVGLWQFNSKTGEAWSTEHCRVMLGLPHDAELTRESFLAAVHPDDRDTVIAAMRSAEAPQFFDARIVLQDGEIRWYRIRSVPTPDAEGASGQLAGIIVDITGRKVAEADAALQRQQVTHLMRVSMLGELSGAIAHEVNQPLTAIMSNAQAALHLLQQRPPDLPEVREALKDIVSEDSRAGEVIQRLRMLMKKGESHFQPVDIHELVRSTANILHSELIARGIRLHTTLATGLPAVSGDLVQLQQVLINLIVNATDAMATTPSFRRVISISTAMLPSGAVELRIKDNGTGLRPADRGKLFEAFYTTKPNGLGLGLSICATIIQAHRGELTLVNDEMGGAVAILTLPVQQALLTDETLFAAK